MKGKKPTLWNVVPMKGTTSRHVPDAPSFMSEEGREVWERLAAPLITKGRLEPEFEDLFAAYCEAVGDFIKMTGVIAIVGSFYETKTRNGLQEKKRAAWGQRQDAIATMRQLAALFGLSPVDDKRLAGSGQGDLLDLLEKQLNGTD